MSFRSLASSRCSVRMKTILASALRVQRRLARFSAADVWCSNPGFATLGGAEGLPCDSLRNSSQKRSRCPGGDKSGDCALPA